MKPKEFNICPSCIHLTTCVLTDQKSLVWSCSEYDELIAPSMVSNKMGINQKVNDIKHSKPNFMIIRNDMTH